MSSLPTRPSDPATWKLLLDEWARSGLTQRAFAEARGYPAYLLSYWKRRLAELAEQAPTPAPTFVPVTLTVPSAPAPPVQRQSFELLLPGARTLRIPPDFDADALQRLLRVVQVSPC